MRRALMGIAGLTMLAAMALPASAGAVSTTLSQDAAGDVDITFAPGAAPDTPGSIYPSAVQAPAGTVNDVNVSVLQSHANPDDLDVVLVSPNGTAVTLQSDACGSDAEFQNLRFDEEAPPIGALSNNGPCDQSFFYIPSNYEGTDLYPGDGPPNTTNALAAYAGGPSGGAWRLFTVDDTTGNGGTIQNWTMTLDFTPPPPTDVPIFGPVPAPLTTPNTVGTPQETVCKKKKKIRLPNGKVKVKKTCKKVND